MRRRRSIEAADDSNEVNLTPMLDVVFIMLIFFIGEGSVVIQADRESTTGVLIEVMDRLQQAGVEQVAVAASRSAP